VVHDKWAKCWVGPVLLNIVDSYCKFREAFTKLQNNFKRVPFYCYKAFGYGRGIANKLDDEFFGVDNNTNSNKGIGLVKATWENITDGDVIQSMVTVGNFLGVELPREQYVNIRNAYKCAVNKYRKPSEPSHNITQFFSGFKKGLQVFRRTIMLPLKRGTAGGLTRVLLQ
jgi:hypothetical protein